MNWELDALKMLAKNPTVPGVALKDTIEEIEKLRVTLSLLADAESIYRHDHDVFGDGSLAAGRAWDNMRKCGDRARAILEKK